MAARSLRFFQFLLLKPLEFQNPRKCSIRTSLLFPIRESSSLSSIAPKDDLRSRILRLRFPRKSAAAALQRWVGEGGKAALPELRRIALELRKSQRYKHALEVCLFLISHHRIRRAFVSLQWKVIKIKSLTVKPPYVILLSNSICGRRVVYWYWGIDWNLTAVNQVVEIRLYIWNVTIGAMFGMGGGVSTCVFLSKRSNSLALVDKYNPFNYWVYNSNRPISGYQRKIIHDPNLAGKICISKRLASRNYTLDYFDAPSLDIWVWYMLEMDCRWIF